MGHAFPVFGVWVHPLSEDPFITASLTNDSRSINRITSDNGWELIQDTNNALHDWYTYINQFEFVQQQQTINTHFRGLALTLDAEKYGLGPKSPSVSIEMNADCRVWTQSVLDKRFDFCN